MLLFFVCQYKSLLCYGIYSYCTFKKQIRCKTKRDIFALMCIGKKCKSISPTLSGSTKWQIWLRTTSKVKFTNIIIIIIIIIITSPSKSTSTSTSSPSSSKSTSTSSPSSTSTSSSPMIQLPFLIWTINSFTRWANAVKRRVKQAKPFSGQYI